MEAPDIGRVVGSQSSTARSPSPGLLRREVRPERRQPGDRVELTEPNRVALRLLRERVLGNTRTALELGPAKPERIQFARVPNQPPHVFLDRLLSDQNLLATQRRSEWPRERVEAALERGLVQGTAETTEILFELHGLDVDTWRLVSSVLDEFYRKVAGVDPETMRAELWDEVNR